MDTSHDELGIGFYTYLKKTATENKSNLIDLSHDNKSEFTKKSGRQDQKD
jgi:hypothetical protein